MHASSNASPRCLRAASHSARLLLPALLVGGLIADVAPAFQATSQQWLINERQGAFSISPIGLLLNGSSLPTVPLRSAGIVTAPPVEWSSTRFGSPSALVPDYSSAALLEGINRNVLGTPFLATELALGGFSTGGDVCGAILPSGNMDAGTSWYGLSVTLAAKPVGQTYGVTNSTLRSLSNAPGSIVTYYYDDSTGLDINLIDSTTIEQTDTQMGFDSIDAVDLEALDWNMGSISGDPTGVRTASIAPVRDRFYFSVAGEWTTLNELHFIDPFDPNPVQLSPDTIYVMQWEQDPVTLDYQWSAPEVAFSPEELFGPERPADIEIDALTVYSPAGEFSSINRVLFSAKGDVLADQLMGFDRAQMTSPTVSYAVPVRDYAGGLISAKLGLHVAGSYPDDVNGMCGLDPGLVNKIGGYWLSGALASPLSQTSPTTSNDMGIAVFRSIELNGALTPVDTMTIQVTGIDQPPSLTGLIHFEFGFFDPAILPIANHNSILWNDLIWVAVPAGATTVELPIPGDLPLALPIAFRAMHHVQYGAPVNRWTEISALLY